MAEAHHPTTSAPESSSSSRGNGNEAADFECNICFEIPHDPVITLCGHLYCWPCLYTWLRGHSQSNECPVCKALIDEEKVIPLYGRGKTPVDPRLKSVPGVEIPNRPAGQRPEAVHLSDNNLASLILGLMGGLVPVASASFSNFGMSAGFGGLVFPFFGVQLNGFSNANSHSGSSGYNYGYAGSFRDSEGRMNRQASQAAQLHFVHVHAKYRMKAKVAVLFVVVNLKPQVGLPELKILQTMILLQVQVLTVHLQNIIRGVYFITTIC